MNESEIKSFLKSGALQTGPAPAANLSVEENMALAQRALDEAKAAAAKEAEEAAKKEAGPPEDPTQYSFTGIDSPVMRKAIEARLQPIDLDDLLFKGFVTQRVPIIPGKLEVEYRSLSDTDTTWCESTALRESMEAHGGLQRVAAIRSSRLALALSVRRINDNQLSLLTTSAGKTQEIMDRAQQLTTSYPTTVIHAMAVNMVWFNSRAAKVLSDAIFLGRG